MNRSDVVEPAESTDPSWDFCLWPYAPPRPPAGGIRSSSLLWSSFATASISDRAFEMCKAIRTELGQFRTVWGIKRSGGSTSWELYFYDYGRIGRTVTPERVLSVVRDHVDGYPNVRNDVPYFMFSLEFDVSTFESTGGHQRAVDVYVDSDAGEVNSGLCYEVGTHGTSLKNIYHFYQARGQADRAWNALSSSALIDGRHIDRRSTGWSFIDRCRNVVIARKRNVDGVYYSGLDSADFLGFLRFADAQDPLIEFAENHREELGHLRFDVGLDVVQRDVGLEVVRTACFGIL